MENVTFKESFKTSLAIVFGWPYLTFVSLMLPLLDLVIDSLVFGSAVYLVLLCSENSGANGERQIDWDHYH